MPPTFYGVVNLDRIKREFYSFTFSLFNVVKYTSEVTFASYRVVIIPRKQKKQRDLLFDTQQLLDRQKSRSASKQGLCIKDCLPECMLRPDRLGLGAPLLNLGLQFLFLILGQSPLLFVFCHVECRGDTFCGFPVEALGNNIVHLRFLTIKDSRPKAATMSKR